MRLCVAAAAVLLPLACFAQTPNTLSAEEKAAGWRLLFDGKTMAGWNDATGGDSWTIADGCIHAKPHPRVRGDLISHDTFRDFELSAEWRIAPGSNTGLKYLIQKTALVDHARPRPRGTRFEDMVADAIEHPVAERRRRKGKAKKAKHAVTVGTRNMRRNVEPRKRR